LTDFLDHPGNRDVSSSINWLWLMEFHNSRLGGNWTMGRLGGFCNMEMVPLVLRFGILFGVMVTVVEGLELEVVTNETAAGRC